MEVSHKEAVMAKLPPASRVPKNLHGPAWEVEELNVGSWCPLPDGKGPATQVHLTVTVKGFDAPLVFRFKGTDTLDRLIGALVRHRNDVWPGAGPVGGTEGMSLLGE
jgi:hypothetical protein